ncbi:MULTISPECIES: FG-GAP-like repeat-containing protein [unclassified Microbacterium]|uniref:FG-GAP-like repeat-containing protein n=1 Tax=unclassified Microbacterium TaxID=2609290 RepID=UPI00109C1CB2|nr:MULTISPECIES: FG-GAP-like repeat-containing protein [unclassified Microbacterium]
MSRRAPRSRNTLRTAPLLTCVLAVSALILGTVVPSAAAQATVASPVATAANAPAAPVDAGVVKTSLAGFTPGNIISDAVFTNKSTMTEAQIQTFFNGKVARCLGGRDENNEPIVCLKDFKMTTVTRPADAYCSGYKGAANESAARIIYRVAQACNINPQVLIVMLQKEQGLITHTWPSAWRYRIALGQGCPDTAPCDPNYIGFFHQIYGAARQMQIYMEGKWFQWYAPGKTWNILYNPKASCGSAPVYVANKATSALYYYTPYQPNAAALRAGYGEGDGCSAYGNRNFYNYFTDWFGSTQKPSVPAGAPPTLASANTSPYVLATSADGTVWGYPFARGVWGKAVSLSTGLTDVSSVHLVGDMNGDGNRDILAVGKDKRAWSLLGAGDKTFSARTQIAVDWSGSVMVTPAGDFDGDGVPDMFTTDKAGALLLWRGDDRGGFRAPVTVGSGWNGMNMLVGGFDFNGDGRPDLIGRDSGGRLTLYTGDGRGKWGGSVRIGTGWQNMTAIMSPGDFDGDGRPDLLARDAAGALWQYAGDGRGAVKAGKKVGTGWQSMVSIQGPGVPVTKARPMKPGVGDVDNDGKTDVVATAADGSAILYTGSGAGGWLSSRTIASGWGAKDRVLPLGDFTGDGKRDIGRIDESGRFLLHSQVGVNGDSQQIGQGWAGLDLLIGTVDFDGDRLPDVLARDASGNLILYSGNGKGSWLGSRVVGKGWSSMDAAFYVGDFDGDGKAGDIIARRTDGTLWLYSLAGDGTWGDSRQIGKGWGAMAQIISPGDFDGDGKIDVLARTATGELLLYSGDGRGGWLSSRAVGKGWVSVAPIG